ncbi:cold shock domain-containing protein [Candidatus Woesearchaeota archaeon]|nr:cold shock domain-containing protein [Candidatus Woesearchaeota archaeon]
MEGTVKWFNIKKGYGFVEGDDGEEYFVHHSALPKGTFIRENDRVSFEPAETERGKQAKNVALLEKGSERESSEGSDEASEESDEQSDENDEQEE